MNFELYVNISVKEIIGFKERKKEKDSKTAKIKEKGCVFCEDIPTSPFEMGSRSSRPKSE